MTESRGILLILLAALVSGVAIFLNSSAVSGFNPFAFTTAKNIVAALFLFSAIILFKDLPALRKLSQKQWFKLGAIGLVGGSIPFLLFFYALSELGATSAGFIHKTLFIWATVFALIFLREKISKQFIAAAILLLAGNFLVIGFNSFALPEFLILTATLLWALENIISKNALKEISPRIVTFGRMFFGSGFMLAFLAATNQLAPLFEFSFPQLQWVLLTSSLLFLFVLSYYSGLKHLPVHKASSLLLLGQPVTFLLSIAFLGKELSLATALGLFLIVVGAFLVVETGFFLKKARIKGLLLAARRT